MKVLVIGGGISDEREISLKSSRAVFEAAKQKGHDVDFYDWDGSDSWLAERVLEFEVVLPVLHGTGGEDGQIQQILEKFNAPYLGSEAAVSRLCFDKKRTLELLRENGITTPVSKLVTFEEYKSDELFDQPHVLKPFNSGSGVDIFIYADPEKKNLKAIQAAFESHEKLLLEQFISGVEVTVSVLDGKELPVIEIIPPKGGVFDYENKYNGQTQELVPAQSISEEMQQQIYEVGQKVHLLTGCRHLSRTDIIVSENQCYVLEINTMPGMTDQSLFPKAVAYVGLAFPEFVDYLIELVRKKV